jgi:CDGSH-type Zn-finger protein
MADVKITVKPNGPYRVEGVVDLVDKAGNHFPKSEFGFSLCRCGHSGTKPLCDGSHARVGFQAEAEAPMVEAAQEAEPVPVPEVTTTTKLEE